jgi:hypothetical protein
VIGWNWDCGLPVEFKIEMYGEREIVLWPKKGQDEEGELCNVGVATK